MASQKQFNICLIVAIVGIAIIFNFNGIAEFIYIFICFVIGANFKRLYALFNKNKELDN